MRRAALAALCAAALALVAATAVPAPAAGAEPGTIATFHYTGGPQIFTVPPGVSYLTFDVIGGRGGYPNRGGAPGPGGETIGGLYVTPGQKLTIWVGENAGGSGGWGYTCGGDKGIGEDDPPGAYDGGGGGGSSAVTRGEWTQGAGTCVSSTRPTGAPLIVGGGGGGGGGDERIPLSKYLGGSGGAGGNPAQAGFPGQGAGPSRGGKPGEGVDNEGGGGASENQHPNDTMGGGGGGGGGYTDVGNGGGGGGELAEGNGASFGGAGGAGGTSYVSNEVSSPVYLAGPRSGSGVVRVSAVHEEGFECGPFIQHPKFPAGVQYAHVIAEGAAGGTRSGSSEAPPGKGGHGGIVSADLAGFAWDKLNVFVGCAGSDEGGGGGSGYGKGGDKGVANAEEGEDGAGGGGGSALEIGEFPVVVAGGGGGGGGGAETLGETIGGGDGGDGGPPGDHSTPGHDGDREVGGDGGCPGSAWKHHLGGGNGGGSSTRSGGGGGGGGGGGWGGACGGEGGNFPNGGGGGGGGGGSYALEHSAAVTNAKFSTSSGVETDGKIVFSYVVSVPSHLSVAGGSGQQAPIGATFAKPLQARVVDQEGRPLNGIPVTFAVGVGGAGSPSGHFAGGSETATVSSDVHGIATSPRLVANLQTGNWEVQAETSGATPADFDLANTALPTGTALKASANPALAGEPVTFTATVKGSSGGPAPSGAVQFKSDGANLGMPVPLTGATAQKSAELALGSHLVEATFIPDQGFETSHAKLTQEVEKATSATKVTSSANPSGFGDAVAFTAHVTNAGSQAATGTVQFEVDGAPLGAPVALSGGSATSESTTALAVAAHEVVAKYSGDGFVAASEGKLTQSVGPDATATELEASVNPSVFGQAVTYSATVKGSGVETPTGTIVFSVDGAQACEAALAGGSAGCEPGGTLAPGSHEVRADYAGDADFDPSHGILTQTVAKAATATAVSADVESPRFGQPVSFSAAVSTLAPGAGTPTGVVQFFLGDEPLGAPATISGGVASTPPISTLPVGVNAVSATYLGDADHLGSGETLFEEVTRGATSTTLTSSANPTHFGVPVTFTAKVAASAPAGGEPGGSVRFSLDGKAICDVALGAGGEAKCAAPTLYVGDHEVLAEYSGEADFEPSDGSLRESVVRVPSYTVVSTSASKAEVGQTLTLSADVGGLPPETPAGTVTFSSGPQVLGTAQVRPLEVGTGRAELETSALPAGSHEIVARYNGDEAIEPSSSLPIVQTVGGGGEAKPRPAAATTCAARNVRARVLVFRGRNAVRLVVRNRAEAAATVKVRFSDERGRGKPRSLGTIRHEFAGEGMYRVVRKLPAAEMRRLREVGGGIAASIVVGGAPGYCAEESAHPLSVRRLVSGQRVWFQDGSAGHELPRNSRR